MKRVSVFLFSLLFAILTLSACAPGQTAEEVYRGTVTAVNEDGSFEVQQLAGHNYGQASIVFRAGKSVLDKLETPLAPGAFVEVRYNGVLTRSLPPQGTAASITQIASFSDGIIQNGTILSVTTGKDGYSISLLPFGAEKTDDLRNTITLTVYMFALEGLTEKDLVEGLKVCAVTSGIAAESLPPIMQVVALLPYTE